MRDDQRIAAIFLDERSVVRRNPRIEHERKVAIDDLLEDNRFALAGDLPAGDLTGPFHLHLSLADNRLVFDVRSPADEALTRFVLPLGSFRVVIRDYFLVCDTHIRSAKTNSPSRIEAIDMGRRSLHDEGGEILQRRLAGKADIDMDTARRLFTLICVLHLRG